MFKRICSFMFCCLLFMPTNVLANSASAISSSSEITQKEIDEARESFLEKIGKTNPEDMTYDEFMQYKVIVDSIKSKDEELNEIVQNEIMQPRTNVVRTGQIFVTGDSSTSSINHGHAGIGANSNNCVIEANPNVGVQKYYNRISGYWSRVNSSILKVRNASSSKYTQAYNFANSKIGRPYKNPVTGLPTNGYYCSELVYESWRSAGYYINGWGAGIIWPQSIYEDSDVVVVKRYGTGF